MTNKDIMKYAKKNNWSKYKESLANISLNSDTKVPLVNDNTIEMYNFDKITKDLFPKNSPTSVDAIFFFDDKTIHMIEFKSGFYSKISKDNFDEELTKCDKTGKKCKKYWEFFSNMRKKEILELKRKIVLKAIESYYILEKNILLECDELKNHKKNKLALVIVIDALGTDGEEDMLYELAGEDLINVNTDNIITSLKETLKEKLHVRKDKKKNDYFYDEIYVKTVEEYENFMRIHA